MKGRPELLAKLHQIDTVQEAVAITIHGSRGADGEPLAVKAIASDLSVDAWKLYQTADGDRKLKVEELPALIRATNNPLILDVVARKVGRVTFPLPQGLAAFPELAGLTARTAREYAEFLTELATAISDGHITRDEAARLRQEGNELIGTLCQAMSQIDQQVVAEPRLRAAR
jgi:hypothetical protein